MIWFGSSAGVALARICIPKPSRSALGARRLAGHVAYVVGFFVMLAVLGWHPDAPR